MIDERFVLLGAALSLLGSGRYAWQTLRGRTRPNRVTWALWTAAPAIGFVAQLDDGVGWSSVMTLSIGLGPAIVLAATFANSSGYWRLTAFDYACGAMSVVALVVWLSLSDPVLAVVFSVVADALGGLPTLRKAWREPDTERPGVFALSGLNGVITALTIPRWTLSAGAFPVYIIVTGTVLTTVVLTRRGRAGVVVSAG